MRSIAKPLIKVLKSNSADYIFGVKRLQHHQQQQQLDWKAVQIKSTKKLSGYQARIVHMRAQPE